MRRALGLVLVALATGAALLFAGRGIVRAWAADALPQQADFHVSGAMTQGGWARGRVPAGTQALLFDGKPVSVAPDGSFFVAFDRDASTRAALSARLASGATASQTLTISPRAWQLEYIPLGPKPGTPPSEAFRLRREAELAQINAARAVRDASDGWRQSFIWPVKGRISGKFGSQRIYNGTPGAYHSGLDIAPGRSGVPIVAPADGVVVLAADQPFTLEGHLLMVDHGMGLNSAFLHCQKLLVKVGDRVKQGQVIALVGMTGRATGPHLHWSIKWNDSRLDPLLFVDRPAP